MYMYTGRTTRIKGSLGGTQELQGSLEFSERLHVHLKLINR